MAEINYSDTKNTGLTSGLRAAHRVASANNRESEGSSLVSGQLNLAFGVPARPTTARFQPLASIRQIVRVALGKEQLEL